MLPDEFNGKAGEVTLLEDPTYGQYHAFTPLKLPPKIMFDNGLVNLLSEANMSLGMLNGLGINLQNPQLITNYFLSKESISSTGIEGTQSSMDEILRADAKVPPETSEQKRNRLEVINYRSALREGIKAIKTQEVNLNLLLKLHKVLLEHDVRGSNKEPGKLRTTQNWIGSTPKNATYVPPISKKVPELMENLFWYTNLDDSMPKLLKIGLIHYQFETIHPFRDGNGRIGRLLIMLYLLKQDFLKSPLMYISSYFEDHRDRYEDLLQNVRRNGDFNPWLKFFLEGVCSTAKEGNKIAMDLLDYKATQIINIKKSRNSSPMLSIFERLCTVTPYIDIPKAKDIAGVTYPTARDAIYGLVKMGILEQLDTDIYRAKMYRSRPIMDIITKKEK